MLQMQLFYSHNTHLLFTFIENEHPVVNHNEHRLKNCYTIKTPWQISTPLASELTHHKNEYKMPNAQF